MKIEKIKQVFQKLDLSFNNKVPFIHQAESSECGLACLSMICGFYGKNIDMMTLRQKYKISSRGVNLKDITIIAKRLGLTSRALSVDLQSIKSLRLPVIIHWDFNHFVVLVKVTSTKVVIYDPASGPRKMNISELSQHFTGVVLETWPSSEFKEETIQKKLGLRMLINSVHGIKKVLLNVFLFSFIIELIGILIPIGSQLVIDHVIPINDKQLLMLICIGIIFFILFRTFVAILRSWALLVLNTLIEIQWKISLFSHLMQLSLDYFERRKLGDIQSRFLSVDTLRNIFTTNIVGIIIDSIITLGILTVMTIYNVKLTLFVVAFLLVYVSVRLFTYQYYKRLSEDEILRDARVNSHFMESLYGIVTIKMQGIRVKRENYWLNLVIDKVNSSIKLKKMNIFFDSVNTLIISLEQVFFLWLGVIFIIDSKITMGMFFAFGLLRTQLSNRVTSLTDYILELRMLSIHSERVSDIALNEVYHDETDSFRYENKQSVSLEVKKLIYSYDGQSRPIFDGLDINIRSGESVAIVGSSGVGKTTLLKILSGLIKQDSGEILIDNINIKQLGLNNYQKIISCVMQEDKLFSGSLEENICGFSDNIDRNWMIECANNADIHHIIMAMPMQYETLIGELGEGLSGGQKQRLFIARALYRKPSILFMDEATSHLDNQSEEKINLAIKKLSITRIIVAHRESTILSADRVIHL